MWSGSMRYEPIKKTWEQAFTMIELLVVIAIIAILAGLLLPAVIGGLKKGEITHAQTDVKLIAAAMGAYLLDYNKYPGQAKSIGGGYTDKKYDYYWRLTATLCGSNIPGGDVATMLGTGGNNWYNQNPKNKVYLQVPDSSISTNGTETDAYAITATRGDLMDPWGNRYVVVADWSQDGKVTADGETILQPVAVWSWGPDQNPTNLVDDAKNRNHIRSWR
jgi:prepilin-type N-terminal cleavage/methylation domain-containing protein